MRSTILALVKLLRTSSSPARARRVLAVNEQTASWVRERFGQLLSRCSERSGREFRFASEPERRAFEHKDQWRPAEVRALSTDQKEAI